MTDTGWWTFSFEGVKELTDADLEHIAELIKEGYTSGQVVHFEQDDEEEGPE